MTSPSRDCVGRNLVETIAWTASESSSTAMGGWPRLRATAEATSRLFYSLPRLLELRRDPLRKPLRVLLGRDNRLNSVWTVREVSPPMLHGPHDRESLPSGRREEAMFSLCPLLRSCQKGCVRRVS
eukprot:scaffold481_cov238-Pinguiococcus_pyrenoidosus.AAC.2